MQNEAVIEIRNLSKIYRDFWGRKKVLAVKSLSMDVYRGEVFGLLGPNGSGKSNVVDAIKWILGDQSPKSLRGKEMTDVIFNGSANRKPAPLAEAMLTFDNAKRILALDAEDISILKDKGMSS